MFRPGRLTRKTVALSVGRGAGVAAQFALNMLLVRVVSQHDFGWFHEIRVVLTFAALLDLGIPLGLLQVAGAAEPGRRHDLYRTALAIAGAAGLATGAILFLVGFLPAFPGLSSAFAWSGFLIAATIVAAVLESALVVEDRHAAIAAISAISALGGLALALVGVLWRPSISVAYAALALAACARAVALAKVTGVAWTGVQWRPLAGAGQLLKTSIAVSGHRALGIASGTIDRAVVGIFFSAGTLAWYVTGAWEVPFMSVFFSAIASAILPEMSAHWTAKRNVDVLAVWHRSITMSAWLIFPIWLWSWIWAPELLRVLFTRQYEDGLPVFRIYLLALPVRIAVYSSLLVAMGRSRVLVNGAVIDVAVNLVLSVVLAAAIGPLGPAIATAVATYVQAGYYVASVRGELRTERVGFFPWGSLFWALTGAGLVTLPTLVLRRVFEGDLPRAGIALAWTGGTLAVGAFLALRKRGPDRE